MHGGAGHDQVAHTGKAGEGALCAAQRPAQPRHFQHGACQQQRLGVVAVAHAVADTAAQRHHVLHGAADFHAHDIGTGVHTEATAHEGVLYGFGGGFVPAGGDAAGGEGDGHLLRVGGAGKGDNGEIGAHFLFDQLRHPQVRTFFNALGDGHQNSAGPEMGRRGPGGFAYGEGGRRQHRQIGAVQAGKIRGNGNALGQLTLRQERIDTGLGHLERLFPVAAPKRYPVSVIAQQQGQSRAPAAAAQYRDVHFSPSFGGLRWK